MGHDLSPRRGFLARGAERASASGNMIRCITLLACVLGLLTACRSHPKTPSTVPEEVLRSPARLAVVVSTTPTVPVPLQPGGSSGLPAMMPEVTPTPVGVMKRTSPARLPPQRIVVPGIKLDAPVRPMAWRNVQRDGLATTEWSIPANAAGYQMGSAFPGQQGNTVLVGHHNIEGRVFENLRHLAPGDQIYLYTEEDVFSYVVEDSFLLRELGTSLEQRYQNARWIGPTTDERLTLVTCWPPTGNAYRLIVIAKPASLAVASSR